MSLNVVLTSSLVLERDTPWRDSSWGSHKIRHDEANSRWRYSSWRDAAWRDLSWREEIRHDEICHDEICHDETRHDEICHEIRNDKMRHDRMRHDNMRHDKERHGYVMTRHIIMTYGYPLSAQPYGYPITAQLPNPILRHDYPMLWNIATLPCGYPINIIWLPNIAGYPTIWLPYPRTILQLPYDYPTISCLWLPYPMATLYIYDDPMATQPYVSYGYPGVQVYPPMTTPWLPYG